MPEQETVTYSEAAELAEALSRPGPAQSVFGTLAQMEFRSRLAGRLITAMLRQAHSSDLWRLPPEA
jgi:hypothetical protein